MKGLVEFLLGGTEKQQEVIYVGISRVVTHKQLNIGPG